MTTCYCVKCKKSIEAINIEEGKTKRGVDMVRGNCPVCNTKVCRIGGKK